MRPSEILCFLQNTLRLGTISKTFFFLICSEIFEKGGLDHFIRLLSDAKPSVQGNSAVCVTNFAQEGMCDGFHEILHLSS